MSGSSLALADSGRSDDAVAYVLVSQVYNRVLVRCPKADDHYGYTCSECRFPDSPRCVPSRENIQANQPASHWGEESHAHYSEEPNGRSALGPLHYFRDCDSLGRRGNHRRADSRIVGLPIAAVEVLSLPVCKTCAAKLAAMEAQIAPERTAHAASPLAPTEEPNPIGSLQVETHHA